MKFIATLAPFLFTAPMASAVDYRVIVDRDPDAIELFVQIPAPLLPDKFADFPDGFLTADAQVDITPFRNGTWDHGDAFFEGVSAQVGGYSVAFEAMSMMVHPADFDVEFRDPIDAIASISVCAVPDGLSVFPLDTLTAYMGYIAYPVDGYADLDLQFPTAAEVEIAEFDRGRPARDQIVMVAPDIAVHLAGFAPQKDPWWMRLFN